MQPANKYQAILMPHAAPVQTLAPRPSPESAPKAPRDDANDHPNAVVALPPLPWKSISPEDAIRESARGRGVLLDVRTELTAGAIYYPHHRAEAIEIEHFVTGALRGARVGEIASLLIHLASRWRAAYVVAESHAQGASTVRQLAKLGFKDAWLVVEPHTHRRFFEQSSTP